MSIVENTDYLSYKGDTISLIAQFKSIVFEQKLRDKKVLISLCDNWFKIDTNDLY